MLRIETSVLDDYVELCLHGEVDISTVDQLQYAWNEAVEIGEAPVIVDLQRLTFLDSTGAKFLLRCALEMGIRNRSWRIVRGDNRWTEVVLDSSCWEVGLPLYRTLEQALQSLRDMPAPPAPRSDQSSPVPVRDSAPVLWLADATTRELLYVSENVSTLVNGTPQLWLTKPDGLFGILHPDDRERVTAAWHATVRLGLPQGFACRILTDSPVGIRCQVLMAPVRDASGRVRCIRGTLHPTRHRRTSGNSEVNGCKPSSGCAGDADHAGDLSTLVELFRQDDSDELTKAEALHKLRTATGKPWKQVAHMVGLSHTYAKRLAGLLNLEEPVRARIRSGELPVRVAFALMPLPPERQIEVAERAVSERLTAEKVRTLYSSSCTTGTRRTNVPRQ